MTVQKRVFFDERLKSKRNGKKVFQKLSCFCKKYIKTAITFCILLKRDYIVNVFTK